MEHTSQKRDDSGRMQVKRATKAKRLPRSSVSFLKPWVQECLTSKLRTLLRHEIEGGPDFDTLEKMHSSEAFDLVSDDANKRDYKDYVEMLIARGLLDENAMIAAYNKSYCGFPSALFESSFLEERIRRQGATPIKTDTRALS